MKKHRALSVLTAIVCTIATMVSATFYTAAEEIDTTVDREVYVNDNTLAEYTFEKLLDMSKDEICSISDKCAVVYREAESNYNMAEQSDIKSFPFHVLFNDDSSFASTDENGDVLLVDEEIMLDVLGLPVEIIREIQMPTDAIVGNDTYHDYILVVRISSEGYNGYEASDVYIKTHIALLLNPDIYMVTAGKLGYTEPVTTTAVTTQPIQTTTTTTIPVVTMMTTRETQVTLSGSYVHNETVTVGDGIPYLKSGEYSSSDESVVAINEYGNPVAVGVGTATVSVMQGNSSVELIHVTVIEPVVVTTSVTDFIDISTCTIINTTTEIVTSPILTSKTTQISIDDLPVVWSETVCVGDIVCDSQAHIFSSDNESVVAINEDGLPVAVGVGTARITGISAPTYNVNKIYIVVTVEAPVTTAATTTTYETTTITTTTTIPVVTMMTTRKTQATLSGSYVHNETVTVGYVIPHQFSGEYSSSDESVVAINEYGNPVAVGVGTATVSVMQGNSSVELIHVTVIEPVVVTTSVTDFIDISTCTIINTTTEIVTLPILTSKTTQISIDDLPVVWSETVCVGDIVCDSQAHIFSSDNESVVAINEDGLPVAVGVGTARITGISAPTYNVNKIYIDVTVEAPVTTAVSTTSVSVTTTTETTTMLNITTTSSEATTKSVETTEQIIYTTTAASTTYLCIEPVAHSETVYVGDVVPHFGQRYTSDDEAVVDINEAGEPVAVGVGTAFIQGLHTDYTSQFGQDVYEWIYVTVIEREETYFVGDVTGDDKIDLYDAVEIAKGIMSKRTFTEEEVLTADFNGDGEVNLYDVIEIAKTFM